MKVRAGVTAHVPIAGVEIPARCGSFAWSAFVPPDAGTPGRRIWCGRARRRAASTTAAPGQPASPVSLVPTVPAFALPSPCWLGRRPLPAALASAPASKRNSRGLALQVQQARVDLAGDVRHLSCKHGGVRVALLDLVRFLLAHHDCPVQVRALLGVVPVISRRFARARRSSAVSGTCHS